MLLQDAFDVTVCVLPQHMSQTKLANLEINHAPDSAHGRHRLCACLKPARRGAGSCK
jgi:hypothetical protein